jgi:hypothetical protein
MSRRGDDGSEMPRHDPFDDAAFDRLLSGQSGPEMGALASFIADARTAAEAVPAPSPALAAALATGILPVPAPVSQSLWAKFKLKVQGFLGGMGVAGKIALGVGVAAAATTGAGAAGILPGPVQHAVASAVGAVTPFELPDPGNHDGGDMTEPPVGVTTTTSDHHEATATTAHESTPTSEQSGTSNTEPHESTTPSSEHQLPPTTEFVPPPTPTTEHHETPTTENNDGGDHHVTTTTVEEHHTPVTISLSCSYHAADGVTHNNKPWIHCEWTPDPNPAVVHYVLLRGGGGVVPGCNASPCDTTQFNAGRTYSFVVDSLGGGEHPATLGTSNRVSVNT